jgi:CBS domain-containing protein
MASNALKHHPPLNWLGGLSLQKGEHRDTLDLKLSGVVPIVDLARIYAIIARSEAVGTRERIAAGAEAGAVSRKGALELRDAWDVISAARLRHQAAQVRAGGAPDNFMAPGALSELERGHLRDAFGVVRTMQAALGQSRGTLT